MIWRIWSILMVVLVAGVWLLAIPFSPQPILETGTVINLYRDMGIVPEAGAITFSNEIEHDVFEVPERDEMELTKAMASMDMGAMVMDGTAMEGMAKDSTTAMEGMAMDSTTAMEGMAMDSTTAMEGMAMDSTTAMEGMAKDSTTAMEGMAKDSSTAMEGMAMDNTTAMDGGHDEEAEEEAEEEGGHGGGSMAEGLMILAQGKAMDVDREIIHDGIKIDAEVMIDLKEWSVGMGMTMVQPGKTIRLRIRNSGNIPHEFMIMNGAAMQAVNYRLNRPDWNLLEHEAITEVPFLMPGDTVDMVIKITKPGMWMYMCMFPYHMQLGMMGMLMTPDMMGKMDMNREMDLFMPQT